MHPAGVAAPTAVNDPHLDPDNPAALGYDPASPELATARAKGGMSDQLPVLQSQRALFALQRERAASDAALALRLLAVCKAAGLAPQA